MAQTTEKSPAPIESAASARKEVELGDAYYLGKGVEQDYAEAARYYRKAAERDDAEGQYKLAGLYFEGHGVPKDDVQAAYLNSKAAGQGMALAQFKLGVFYAHGVGVPVDIIQAEHLLTKAANQGLVEAKNQLAEWHSSGKHSTCTPDASVMLATSSLPLKAGIWKIETSFVGGNAIQNEKEKDRCTTVKSTCVQANWTKPEGKSWPEWPTEKDFDASNCNWNTVSETGTSRKVKLKCSGLLNLDSLSVFTKESEDKYRISTQAEVGVLKTVFAQLPDLMELDLHASYVGACAQ